MQYPKISIITPSYNQGQYIEETILSVIGQSYPNLEYIIIDGGSTDNSIEIIKKYEKHLAYWVSEKDEGIYDAMNKGIDKATGEWIYFLGTDDMLREGVLVEIFRDKDLIRNDFIYGKVIFRESKYEFGQELDINSITKQNICHQAIFVKKELFDLLGNFNTRYVSYADYDFNLRCFGNHDIKKQFIDKYIAQYYEGGFSRIHGDVIFTREKHQLILAYFGKSLSKKRLYINLEDSIFNFLKYDKSVFLGLFHIIKAIFHTGNIYYYIKNTLYWLKQRYTNPQSLIK